MEQILCTATLSRLVKLRLARTFMEAAKRFGPSKAVLLFRPEGSSQMEVQSSGGFASKPVLGSSDVQWSMIQQCFEQGEVIKHSESDARYLTFPVKRPPTGIVISVLYFENRNEKKFGEEELFALEALSGRAGAEIAVLHKRLLSNVQRVLPTSDLVENWSGIRRAGLEAFGAGVNDMAISFLERAKDLAEEWGPCKELGQSLNDYGQALRANDRLDEALSTFERGMSILEQAGLDRQLHAIPLLNNLGGAHHAKGNLKEAERLYRLGLDIMSEQPGENKATPAIMANLGTICIEMGDNATARVWLQQALSSATRLFGEEHPHTVKCREKLEELQ